MRKKRTGEGVTDVELTALHTTSANVNAGQSRLKQTPTVHFAAAISLSGNQYMNVTIDGYVSYICTRCKQTYTVEGQSLSFNEDTSAESEDDDYIGYIAQLDSPCRSCGHDMLLTLEVWEHPESVANYSYSSSDGVGAVSCEFSIEHYFDDELAQKDGSSDEAEGDAASEDDTDEKVFNESTKVDGYTDEYDHED